MRAVRVLAVLALTAGLAAPLAANPLTEKHLVAVSRAGLSDDAIVHMAEVRGLAGPFTPEMVLRLSEAGLSSSLLSRLVLMSDGDEPIRIEERDGVTVISGRGEARTEVETESRPERGPEEWPAPPPAPPAPEVVIVNGGAPAAASARDSTAGLGYPAGAVFGMAGGAVFLPARFGGNEPSAFGRTIVGFTGGGECCAPYVAPAPVVVAPVPQTRMIPVHTSRGTLWIPN
jgi:hypothetical protein